jgi:hypothetical protein
MDFLLITKIMSKKNASSYELAPGLSPARSLIAHHIRLQATKRPPGNITGHE